MMDWFLLFKAGAFLLTKRALSFAHVPRVIFPQALVKIDQDCHQISNLRCGFFVQIAKALGVIFELNVRCRTSPHLSLLTMVYLLELVDGGGAIDR